jgi:hypothetical protein
MSRRQSRRLRQNASRANRRIRQQNANHNVDLEHAHQAPAQIGRRHLCQSRANAQPSADARYSTAMMRNAPRPPMRCPSTPLVAAPTTVPASAMLTVTPSVASVSANTCRSCAVVPEMTAVSNPNSNPPSAPTTVPRTRIWFSAKQSASHTQYSPSS